MESPCVESSRNDDLIFVDCFALPKARTRNDERVERFFVLQKQNEAKTFKRIFDLIFKLDSAIRRIYNRSNGGVALHCFGAKPAQIKLKGSSNGVLSPKQRKLHTPE